MDEDDDTTRSNGGTPHTTVPGGEVGARLRDVEARLVALDARDTEQHAAVVERLDALARTTEEVGGRLVAGLAALAEEHRRTVTLRVLDLAGETVRRVVTPTSAPIYAVALLVAVVAAASVPVVWGDVRVGAVASAANADSDADRPVSGGE